MSRMIRHTWKTALAACAVAAAAAGFWNGLSARATSLDKTKAPPVQVAPGYRLRQIAGEFTAPIGVAAGTKGDLFVAESGAGTGTPPRVIKLGRNNKRTTLAADFPAPLTGISWHEGKLYVSYAGGVDVLDPDTGLHHPVLTKLPALGDHPNGAVAFGPDGMLYFGIGSATNAGVVGLDNVERGWVGAHPEVRDVPCKTVKLRGTNFTVANPLTPDALDMATTGAFAPFGKTTARLQELRGALPCTGAVLRAKPDGTAMELVAWGLRNPVGLAFAPDGQLYTAVQGFEDRGSRPVLGDRDYVYRVEQGQWYGWPDFAGGRSVTAEEFQKPSMPATPLLAEVPGRPPAPVTTLGHGAGAAGLVFPPASFGLEGDGLLALSRSGQVVRLNTATGRAQPFLRNVPGLNGINSPVAFALSAGGTVLLADLGATRPGRGGTAEPVAGSGAVWEIIATR